MDDGKFEASLDKLARCCLKIKLKRGWRRKECSSVVKCLPKCIRFQDQKNWKEWGDKYDTWILGSAVWQKMPCVDNWLDDKKKLDYFQQGEFYWPVIWPRNDTKMSSEDWAGLNVTTRRQALSICGADIHMKKPRTARETEVQNETSTIKIIHVCIIIVEVWEKWDPKRVTEKGERKPKYSSNFISKKDCSYIKINNSEYFNFCKTIGNLATFRMFVLPSLN